MSNALHDAIPHIVQRRLNRVDEFTTSCVWTHYSAWAMDYHSIHGHDVASFEISSSREPSKPLSPTQWLTNFQIACQR